MSSRAHVYAAVVVALLAIPGVAFPAALVTVSLAPLNGDGTVNGASNASATCVGTGFPTMGATYTGSAVVTGGTFAGGATTTSLAALNTTLAVSTDASGTLSVTCTLTGKSAFTSATATGAASAPIRPAAAAPTVASLDPGKSTVVIGALVDFDAVATDPAGLPLTYAWTANGGSFEPSSPSGPAAAWRAPGVQGTFIVKVTATNSAGLKAEKEAEVTTALSVFQGGLSAVRYPRRMAATASGELLVVDDNGTLALLTKRGDARGALQNLGATAVAVGVSGGKEVAFVATRQRGILRIDPVTGRTLGTIPWRASSTLAGVAYDAGRDLLWGAAAELGRVAAYRRDGSVAMTITSAEGRPLRSPVDVAFAQATSTLWVAERDGLTGNRVHLYDAATGNYLRSMVTVGSGLGQVVDTGGLALGPDGKVYVSDAYSGTVQVLTAAGGAVGTVGTVGETDGHLLQPRGLAFMANGDLAIANSWFNRVDHFGTGADLPVCEGDTDCDGLPDDWELAHGLNPNDASDAALDSDGDGLTNLEEYRLGTDPQKADTDGDGVPDGDELPMGRDPLNGGDGRPSLVASNLGDVPPGLVRLNAVLSNASDCAATWRQTAGAKVTLRDASGFSPAFVARTPGTYRFEAIATCAGGASASAAASATVVNVPPIADAGRRVVTAPNRSVLLQAGYSSDANGDTLTYRWDQVAGPAMSMAARGAALTVRPVTEGRYAFKLSATDRAGARGETTVDVVVVDGEIPTAIVAEPLIFAAAGATVTLDASASLPVGAAFSWQQVEPAVAAFPGGATATFTPPAPGRYVFEVTAAAGGVTSPPARVIVLTGAPPVAEAVAPATGVVNGPFSLEATASGGAGGYAYSWRQIAGPAAGLTGGTSAVVTAVAFSPGAYAFELTVTDSAGAVSAPATVRVDVTSANRPLPAANASAPATAIVNEIVLLDGRASVGASHYRWTQVAGPWVAIDPNSATPIFQPPAAGSYSFELVVDDGTTRSAPASVTIDVQ